MKYINKDRLRTEITKYESTAENAYNPSNEDADYWHGKVVACEDILDIIVSLQQEQPEVDISGEIHKEAMKLHTAPTYDELASFARHFYELGKNSK